MKQNSGRKANGSQILGPNSEIGRKLRQYYDEIASDDVPDRFAQLLSRLEHAENSTDKE
ncbi:MAG: NepR family anti-sigma factor [Rhizobiaceae bacterium]|jgi:hypothetical protein